MSSDWSGAKSLEPYVARASALAALAWFGIFSAAGVALFVFMSEVGGFLAMGAVLVGVCGALVHATLLRLAWFRSLRSGRIIAVAVSTLALLALVVVAHNGVYGSSQGRAVADGVLVAVLFAAVPVLLAAFFITQVVEGAGT